MNKTRFLHRLLLTLICSWSAAMLSAAEAENQELALYVAAKEGRLGQVKSMLASGVNVNAKNATGRSALMGAAYYGNVGVVEELVVEGVDVNMVDGLGRSALMIAITNEKLIKLIENASE